MLYFFHLLRSDRTVENKEFCASDFDVGIRLNELHTLFSRSGALVELSGKRLNGEVWPPLKVCFFGNGVSGRFSKHFV